MYTVVTRDYPTPDGHYEWVVYTGPRHNTEPEYEIPYHAKASGYKNFNRWSNPCQPLWWWQTAEEAYEDYLNTHYFDGWVLYSEEQRKQIRRNTISNFNQEIASLMAHNMSKVRDSMFVTFPSAQMQTVTSTIPQTKEDTNMNTEFHTERTHLERDLYRSYMDAREHLAKKHHIAPANPQTIREVLKYIADGKYDKLNDQELDAKHRYSSPLNHIVFRDGPQDSEGYDKATDALNEDYRAIGLKAKVLEPEKALKEVESFRTRHTIH